jgi:acyl-CoA synthetase (AMP-forming)/AMP-acid ligase II
VSYHESWQRPVEEHGHMPISDRSKDMIKLSGEWISSIEIENLAVSASPVRTQGGCRHE